MKDIFGNTLNVTDSGKLTSGYNTAVAINGDVVAVTQSVNVTYSRNTQAIPEMGSTSVVIVNGTSTGQCSIGRLATTGGWFDHFTSADPCGSNVVTVMKSPNANDSCLGNPGTLTMTNAVFTQVALQGGAQSAPVNESATLMFSGLRKS